MPRKKGQRVKSGSSTATTILGAIDSAMWGDLATSKVRDAVQVVWSSQFPTQPLPPKLAKEWKESERKWEEALGAIVIDAVKSGDEKTLESILDALRHCKNHGTDTGAIKAVDPARTLALGLYLRNEALAKGKLAGVKMELVTTVDGKETNRAPLDLKTTPKSVREHLRQRDVKIGQRTVHRIFKQEHGITLEEAKAGRPKKKNCGQLKSE